MNIGIITFHFPLNYGAVLQAYALSKCLRSLGHNVEIIDYRPDYHVKKYQWQWKNCGFNFQNFIYPVLHKKFDIFRTQHLKLSHRPYRSLEELKADPPKLDAYICGSDQIWNPDITDLDSAYFLDFGPEYIKRISYAGSFGKTELNHDEQTRLKPYFHAIDYLSVRESSGADIINDICGRKAEHVLDPTLLIDDYDTVAEPCPIKKGYVLLLNLQNNTLLKKTAEFIGRELQIPTVVLNNYSMKLWDQRGKRLFPSPGEYLGLIKHADCVVTNSFHGTIFSIIFKKLFVVTALSGHSTQKNTRITWLLHSSGLSDHFLDTFSETHIRDHIASTVDWQRVALRVTLEREKSLCFLKNSLSGGGVL